jgi:adenosylmethionine---8-amino-7-oxononanoate aminotransferase
VPSRAEIVALDKRHLWHPYTPMEAYIASAAPIVVERASGSRIYDVDGRVYLDGNSSWWTALLGHNHPRLVRALCDQAEKYCHVPLAGITHEPATLLATELAKKCPGLPHAFFVDNGSTAVEAAMKMALQYQAQTGHPERVEFVALDGAFHGETLGVTALGGVSAFRAPFSRSVVAAELLPSPADPAVGLVRALEQLERSVLGRRDHVAAVVLEPLVQGAGGMRFYSPRYLERARELTEQTGALLIIDEVFTGFGRTGTFWAHERAAIQPDIVCTAKGLSGGLLPLGAVLAQSRIFEAFLGGKERAFYYGHTYAGNPLGTRVALEVLSVYEDEAILTGALERAQRIQAAFERIGTLGGATRARALGVLGAVELGEGGYLQGLGWEVYEEALLRGAYLRPLGNVVYCAPALNIPLDDLDHLLQIVFESISSVLKRHGQA